VGRRMCDLENLVNEEAIARVGLQRHVKKDVGNKDNIKRFNGEKRAVSENCVLKTFQFVTMRHVSGFIGSHILGYLHKECLYMCIENIFK
jgi:hypothetical protein